MDSESRLKLRFRIVECSSEDAQFPASELLASSSQSNGWCSQRFCSYPQHITFQFLSPVQLKQLQFLSHESRIPSRIEIHVGMPEGGLNTPISGVKFKRLGHLTLDPNERSGFKLRELKTVYVEVHCLYIRLVFHKCHQNKHNFFNQAGLVAMIPFGSTMTSASAKTLKKPNAMLQPLPVLSHRKDNSEQQETVPIDQAAAKKLKQLEEAKLEAVKYEDYEKADRLKQEISKIQYYGSQLKRLEDKKAVAVQNEDYETATMIKNEIVRIREMIYKPTNLNAPHKPTQEHANFFQKGAGSRNELPEQRSGGNLQAMKRNNTHGQLSRQNTTHNYETRENEEVEEEEGEEEGRPQEEEYENQRGGYKQAPPQHHYQQQRYEDEEEYDEYEGEQEDEYNRHQPQQIIPHDEVVIPALLNKGANPEEQMQAQQQVKEAEELSPAAQKAAEPLIPVLGMDLCKKLFSKHWNLREEGLKLLNSEIQKGSQDPWNMFVAVLGAVSRTITDKVSQVSAMSQNVLRTILTKKLPHIGSKNEMVMYMDITLKTLLEKIGDINARVRELAEDSLMCMIRSPAITCNFCLSVILRDIAPTTGKGNLLAKYTLARIRVLQRVIKEFKIDNADVPYLPVVDFTVEKLENPNADVRSASINLLADIYRVVGDKLKKDLDGVRPAHLELLDKEFMAIDVGSGGPRQSMSKSQSKEHLRQSKKSLR